MLRPINFIEARTIVELGAGTGPFTRELLKRMHPEARLIVYETSSAFCKELECIGDPRLSVHNTSALQIGSVGNSVDYVLSGLALANFSREDKTYLLEAIKQVLVPKGTYVQFQYTPESYRMLKRVFGSVRVGFEVRNLPPAFVYECRKQDLSP